MIASLRFGRDRRARFEPSTNVRLATVCAVANVARDQLSRMLDHELIVDVFEPVVVPLEAQPALFSKALVFLAQGRRNNLLVVMRERDARRIASFAFREESAGGSALSLTEERVLERIAREIAVTAAPLCGELSAFSRAGSSADRYECATYFELRFGSPVDAVIGLALAKDPAHPTEACVAPAALANVAIEARAVLARSTLTAGELAALQIGSVVPLETSLDEAATLSVGGTVVARGRCGIRNRRYAFSVDTAVPGAPA